MPGWVKKVTLFLPATYLAAGLEGAMLHAASFGEVLEVTVALAVSLIVAFEVSRRIFRWEPDEKIRGKAKLWAVAALIPFLLLGSWELTRGHLLQEINHQFQIINQRAAPPPAASPQKKIH